LREFCVIVLLHGDEMVPGRVTGEAGVQGGVAGVVVVVVGAGVVSTRLEFD
jgi:hypothetical protein